jgi:hypothetical protein
VDAEVQLQIGDIVKIVTKNIVCEEKGVYESGSETEEHSHHHRRHHHKHQNCPLLVDVCVRATLELCALDEHCASTPSSIETVSSRHIVTTGL